MKNIHLAVLAMTPGIGHVKLRSLIEVYGSAEAVWQADKNNLLASGSLSETLCKHLVNTRENKDIELEDEDRKVLNNVIKNIKDIANTEKTPPIINSKTCKKCAYFDLCYV